MKVTVNRPVSFAAFCEANGLTIVATAIGEYGKLLNEVEGNGRRMMEMSGATAAAMGADKRRNVQCSLMHGEVMIVTRGGHDELDAIKKIACAVVNTTADGITFPADFTVDPKDFELVTEGENR